MARMNAWNSGTRGLELSMETSTTQLLHIFFCYAQTSQKKVAHKRHRYLILNTCSPMTVNQGKHQKGTEQNQVHIPPPLEGIPVTVTITLSHKFTFTLSHKLSVIYISKLILEWESDNPGEMILKQKDTHADFVPA